MAPRRGPRAGRVHDFIDKELGKANPYGVYDVAANNGWVSRGHRPRHRRVRREHHPPLVEHDGTSAYPDANRLLITADGGGSNGSRTRLWKTELAALAAETGLAITVCHLPRAPASGTRSSTGCSPTSP